MPKDIVIVDATLLTEDGEETILCSLWEVPAKTIDYDATQTALDALRDTLRTFPSWLKYNTEE